MQKFNCVNSLELKDRVATNANFPTNAIDAIHKPSVQRKSPIIDTLKFNGHFPILCTRSEATIPFLGLAKAPNEY